MKRRSTAGGNPPKGQAMKTHYLVALAMLAGFGLGAVAVQRLHAQAKPLVYYVTEIDVTDPVGFAKEYLPIVRPTIKADGGRFVALGGPAGGGKVVTIEGAPPASRVAVLVWDSFEKIQAHRDSAEFQKARAIGEKYAKFRSFAVEGLANYGTYQ